MTELYQDHMSVADGLVHDRFQDLDARDYRPEYEFWKVVPSESQSHAYLVAEITVLSVPFQEADLVEDQQTAHLCSCSDFYYNRSKGIESDADPSSMSHCKHLTASFKHIRAKADENQETL